MVPSGHHFLFQLGFSLREKPSFQLLRAYAILASLDGGFDYDELEVGYLAGSGTAQDFAAMNETEISKHAHILSLFDGPCFECEKKVFLLTLVMVNSCSTAQIAKEKMVPSVELGCSYSGSDLFCQQVMSSCHRRM